MATDALEIEVKLPFAGVEDARRDLAGLDALPDRPRSFEDNVLYDTADRTLTRARRILRLRRVGEQAWLTFKQRVDSDSDHLVRIEHETEILHPDAADRMIRALGYSPVYRYQKYRSTYALSGLSICLDETPIGCFVELEGEPEAIDAAARRLGRAPDDYVRKSYRQLHREAAARGEAPEDRMVFADSPGGTS